MTKEKKSRKATFEFNIVYALYIAQQKKRYEGKYFHFEDQRTIIRIIKAFVWVANI